MAVYQLYAGSLCKKKIARFNQDIDYLRKAKEHGICTPEQKKHCRAEYGKWLDHNCESCQMASGETCEYTDWLAMVIRLQDAGYPLQADDLTIEQWLDLARLRGVLEQPVAVKRKANG